MPDIFDLPVDQYIEERRKLLAEAKHALEVFDAKYASYFEKLWLKEYYEEKIRRLSTKQVTLDAVQDFLVWAYKKATDAHKRIQGGNLCKADKNRKFIDNIRADYKKLFNEEMPMKEKL